jgi:hypothetical protein
MRAGWSRTERWIVAACVVIAAISARPYAGGWNDGSRLASVEAIVDHHTLQIDRSIYVDVPRSLVEAGLAPYGGPAVLFSNEIGTCDKLLIEGHYYCDKPLLISLLMAAEYQAWQWLGGPTFAMRPDLVCWLLTFLNSALSYTLATVCIYRAAGLLGLHGWRQLGLTVSFALATIAPTYLRHVNNHIVFLGVMSALMLTLLRLPESHGASRWLRLAASGAWAGIGYSLDLGLGPILVTGLFVLTLWRQRSVTALAVVALGAAPWVIGNHILNYAVGGTIKPANMVAEYLQWPGSPFSLDNMTGVIRDEFERKAVYVPSLWLSKHGFLGYNLPLLLVIPALVLVIRRRLAISAELAFGLVWIGCGWLMYGMLSNNYGGACCTVRWFLPFLAPFFLLVARLVQQAPQYRAVLWLLTAWGVVLAAALWWVGPFTLFMNPLYWPTFGAAVLSWSFLGWKQARFSTRTSISNTSPRRAA